VRNSNAAFVALILAAACGTDSERDDLRTELKALAQSNAPCTTAADCCVVVDGCYAQAFVVAKGDYDKARKLADGLDDSMCVGCESPAVELECVDGACVGRQLDFEEASSGHWASHCGTVVVDQLPPSEGHPLSSPGTTGRILGCGT